RCQRRARQRARCLSPQGNGALGEGDQGQQYQGGGLIAFYFSFVARIERSEIRDSRCGERPGFPAEPVLSEAEGGSTRATSLQETPCDRAPRRCISSGR